MELKFLDLHANNITSEGFVQLMVCLKTNNKVKDLNLSRNNIASDIKLFKRVHTFLNHNKILENLNLSFCNITEKAACMIGTGLRGNRNLQVLNLKGNIVGSGLKEIAKSFVTNTKALCIKELDLSKNQIESEHVTQDCIDMITSEFCTLKTLSFRDNFIKH